MGASNETLEAQATANRLRLRKLKEHSLGQIRANKAIKAKKSMN